MKILLLMTAVMLLLPRLTEASFDEEFDGEFSSVDGSAIGFSLPDWGYTGNGQITNGGLAIENSPIGFGDWERDALRRFIDDSVTSFEHTVWIDDLDLGEIYGVSSLESSGYLQLSHRANVGEGGSMGFILVENEDDEPSDPVSSWYFAALLSDQTSHLIEVPRGSRIEMGMSYDAAQSSATFWYDPNRDDEREAFRLGPIEVTEIDETTFGTQAVSLAFIASDVGHSTGTLTRWQFLRLTGVVGDFDGSGALDVGDIQQLSEETRMQSPDALDRFDINDEGVVDSGDLEIWVTELKGTYFGDANLDGEFASSDLVNVFAAGEYEDEFNLNSTWETGDWNGDGDFTTSDLVLAFQDGGYEQGPRVASSVPEPMGFAWHFLAITLVACRRLTIR